MKEYNKLLVNSAITMCDKIMATFRYCMNYNTISRNTILPDIETLSQVKNTVDKDSRLIYQNSNNHQGNILAKHLSDWTSLFNFKYTQQQSYSTYISQTNLMLTESNYSAQLLVISIATIVISST
jgi:hypothetical protein